MEVEPFPLPGLQPPLHLGAFVGAVVVQDEMHFPISRKFRLQVIEESDKFPAAMTILAGADDLAVEDIERGEQSCRAVAFVVVRLTLRQTGPQRKDRRGTVQRLYLALLVHT